MREPEFVCSLLALAFEEQRADGKQAVKPTTRLIDRFTDKIGGKLRGKIFNSRPQSVKFFFGI